MESSFEFKRKTIHKSRCMVAKKITFYSLCLSAIDILSWKFVDNIELGAFYLKIKEKDNSLHCLFELVTQWSRIKCI
jgi:hypothetical protein